MAEDRYGFMWIATQEGLNFFDGHSFRVFNRGGKNSIAGSDIKSVVYDPVNNLVWMIFSYGGVSAIDCTTRQVVIHLPSDSMPAAFRSGDGADIHLTEEGKLLIVTSQTCVVYDYRQKSMHGLWGYNNSLPGKYKIITASDDKQYYYLFANGAGIICISKKTGLKEKIIPVDSHFSGQSLKKNGHIFFAVENSICRLNGPRGYDVLLQTQGTARCFNFDENDDCWFSVKTELKKALAPAYSRVISIRFPDNDVPQYNLSVFFNSGNKLWVGGSEGLIVSDRSPAVFSIFSKDPKTKLPLTHLWDLLPCDSEVYVNNLDGLYYCNINSGRIAPIDTSAFPYYIFRLNNDIIYNNEKGFALITRHKADKKALAVKYPELQALHNRTLSCHARINDSIIVLGGEDWKGIMVWNIKRHTIKEVVPDRRTGWMDSAVNMLYKYNDNAVLVCQDKCIALYDIGRNTLRNYRLHDVQSSDTVRLYFDILENAGHYLVAAYGVGIIVTDKAFHTIRIINTSAGLSNNGVYRMMKDNLGFLWVSTNNGLNRIDLRNYACKQYFENDGLNTNAFEEMSAAAANGYLFFGGISGFTIIDPANISPRLTALPVYFTDYNFKGDTIDSTLVNMNIDTLRVAPDIIQLTINFAALDFIGSHRVHYNYRIRETGDNWLELGNRHFVSIMRLNPGAYHFEVQAINEDGLPGQIKQLYLRFLPKWYQTGWFGAVVMLAVFYLAWLAWRLRIAQIRKEERIRQRLASDLHDDLGSTLNSVKVYASLALMDKQNETHLQRVKEGIHASINGIRDMIWVLDDKNDSTEHLAGRVEQFARPLCEVQTIKFSYSLDDAAYYYKLGKEERRNLYLVLKESVNNSIKYAFCKKISLVISVARNRLVISLCDDGAGFDTQKVSYGNGLRNIQQRASEIGYRAQIISAEGKGTDIRLVPA